MSLTKIIGAVIGALLGIAITSMFISAILDNRSAPAIVVIAFILLGAFLGSVLGAYVGSWDKRQMTWPRTAAWRASDREDDRDTKRCPDCAEQVKAAARVCRYCGHRFDSETS